MKRIPVYVLVVLCCFSFVACRAPGAVSCPAGSEGVTEEHPYRDHQQVLVSEIDLDADEMFRMDLSAVGLENVFIRDVINGVKLNEDTYASVYLLADDRFGGGMGASAHYLAVKTHDRLRVTDTLKWEDQASLIGEITACDVDGDGDDEILLQETVGMTGGWGQHLSRVFDFSNGKLSEIFSSYGENGVNFDTGFSATVLMGERLRVTNRFTSYDTTFSFAFRDAGYFSHWYDENGAPQSVGLVDSFYAFEPIDIENDGVFELCCRQYTSLAGHTDFVGVAVSILRHNGKTGCFDVVDATFEPAEE